MIRTITIQIGNSDDKLTQSQWAQFVFAVDMEVRARSTQVHFFGFSPADKPWQNACWVAEVEDFYYDTLKRMLQNVKDVYKQASIAWTVGETEFI